jgi:hypothetical protein
MSLLLLLALVLLPIQAALREKKLKRAKELWNGGVVREGNRGFKDMKWTSAKDASRSFTERLTKQLK